MQLENTSLFRRRFSEQNCTANDGGLAKTLLYDIACQLRIPAAIVLVDASNCYDCIAHAMALLVFQSFGVEDTAVTAMMERIQEMKFFLRTAFGQVEHKLNTNNPRQCWREASENKSVLCVL